MFKRYSIFILVIFMAINLFVFWKLNIVSAEDGFAKFTEGYVDTGQAAGYSKSVFLTQPLPQVIGNIIKGILTFLGIIFLLLIIYGGYVWMLARGNENETKKAKDIITNAIIGLLVVAGAYAITYFVSYSLYDSQYFQYNEENEI